MFAKGASASLTALLLLAPLAGCGPDYSPNTYSSNAVQQANKVDQGVIVGVRPVTISADATLGTATGGAAGGIAGSQIAPGATGALTALGGTVAGGLAGNAIAHTTGDTDGFEYIVRKPNNDLLSVTQKDLAPLKIGQHVLIIEGPQARVVVDYTVPIEDPTKAAAGAATPSVAATPAAVPAAQPQNANAASQTTSAPLPPPGETAAKAETGGSPTPAPPEAKPQPQPASGAPAPVTTPDAAVPRPVAAASEPGN